MCDPNDLIKFADNNKWFEITTTEHRKLKAKAVFGEEEFGPKYFKVNESESIPIESVKVTREIFDFYYSDQMAVHYFEENKSARHMRLNSVFHKITKNTINGQVYTEAVEHGEKPMCDCTDAKLIATSSNDPERAGIW